MCNQSKLAKCIAELQSMPKLTPTNQEELEAIDTQLTKILLQADCACTPPSMGPWSPELNQAYLCHCLWSLELTAHQTQ